jgi:hypothetical protein
MAAQDNFATLRTAFASLDNDDTVFPPDAAIRLLAKVVNAICAKLDADAGVTDTNYAAIADAVKL